MGGKLIKIQKRWDKKRLLNKNNPFNINKNVLKLIERKFEIKRRCENEVVRNCKLFGELVHKNLIIWHANSAHDSTYDELWDESAVWATKVLINKKLYFNSKNLVY